MEREVYERYLVRPSAPVRLAHVDTCESGPFESKKAARKELRAQRQKLVKLQEVLYAEDKHALLVVFQAMDTGGKDGVIRHVFSGVNPQGVTVTPFKVPSLEELAHDYLWRIHKAVPRRGIIGVFNRSQYEDVLVVRVHNLVSPEVWGARYEQINQFEKLLSECGVTILKFYLHISKDDQRQRLQARLDDPDKHWKFAVGDLKERALWDQYMAAYEDAVNRTSTPWAPWYVIPSDHKWYRDAVVANVIVDTLDSLDMHFPEPADSLEGVTIPE